MLLTYPKYRETVFLLRSLHLSYGEIAASASTLSKAKCFRAYMIIQATYSLRKFLSESLVGE